MHIKPMTRSLPAPAATLEAILDNILQILNIFGTLEAIFGVDFAKGKR